MLPPGEKPFACRCGRKFTRLDNLRQHALTIHADEPEANEELFERLAANMTRSGVHQPRRQTKHIKGVPNSPRAVTRGPSVLQGSDRPFYDQAAPSLPPPPAYPGGKLNSFRPVSPFEHRSTSSHASASGSPYPQPSPSFRFPSASNYSFRAESTQTKSTAASDLKHQHESGDSLSIHTLSSPSTLSPSFTSDHRFPVTPAISASPSISSSDDAASATSASPFYRSGNGFRGQSPNILYAPRISPSRRTSGTSIASSASISSATWSAPQFSKPVLPCEHFSSIILQFANSLLRSPLIVDSWCSGSASVAVSGLPKQTSPAAPSFLLTQRAPGSLAFACR